MSADDDDIDDASLKSMRAVWLSMRDEEPPAAGMSALMAAAAQKADQMRAEPSWWERLVTQLRRPPALAFATVMLLIGGAVLVTRSQSEKVEALTAEDRPVAREQEAPVATPTTGVAPADPVAEPREEALKQQPEAASDVRSKLEKKPKAKPAVVEEEEVGKNEPDRDHRFEADADMKPGFAGGKASGEDKTVIETPAHKTQAPTIAQPPAEPEPRPSADEGDTITRGNAGPTTTAPKKPEETKDRGSPVPANEQLAKRVEELAARGDCAAVRELVAKIRNSDEAFYKQRLGKNAAVTKCL